MPLGREEAASMRMLSRAVILATLVLAGCTTLRVQGLVYDEETSDGISTCGITVGPRYYHVDTAGHYDVKARKDWKTMTFVAPGYETKIVTIQATNRYPNINVAMKRKAARGAGKAAAIEPDAAKPNAK